MTNLLSVEVPPFHESLIRFDGKLEVACLAH